MELPIDYDKASPMERRVAREQYIKRQNGLCWYCKEPLTGQPSQEVMDKFIYKRLFPENFFVWPVHLHHNHDTGLTIGAVHSRCNAVLWQYHGE